MILLTVELSTIKALNFPLEMLKSKKMAKLYSTKVNQKFLRTFLFLNKSSKYERKLILLILNLIQN